MISVYEFYEINSIMLLMKLQEVFVNELNKVCYVFLRSMDVTNFFKSSK